MVPGTWYVFYIIILNEDQVMQYLVDWDEAFALNSKYKRNGLKGKWRNELMIQFCLNSNCSFILVSLLKTQGSG